MLKTFVVATSQPGIFLGQVELLLGEDEVSAVPPTPAGFKKDTALTATSWHVIDCVSRGSTVVEANDRS